MSKHRDLNKKTECNTCSKIFLTVSDLQEHVRLTHPTKKDRFELSDNSIMRTPKRSPYMCNLCNKPFSRFCDLLDHDEIQHDDLPKRYRCGVCSKMFLMEDRAKVHYNFYHTKTKGTMNFQCSFCGMELKSASAVANHERMHITQNSTQFGYKIIRDWKLLYVFLLYMSYDPSLCFLICLVLRLLFDSAVHADYNRPNNVISYFQKSMHFFFQIIHEFSQCL